MKEKKKDQESRMDEQRVTSDAIATASEGVPSPSGSGRVSGGIVAELRGEAAFRRNHEPTLAHLLTRAADDCGVLVRQRRELLAELKRLTAACELDFDVDGAEPVLTAAVIKRARTVLTRIEAE